MDNINLASGVIDSWDLLYPISDTYIDRNKGTVKVSNLNLLSSSASLFLKETTYTPVFNSISAGYYPVFGSIYKSYPSEYRPLIQVTVCPKSSKTVAHDRRKRHKKKSADYSDHSIAGKKIYIVVPRKKPDKICVIETTNAGIYKEINDNKLLSECILKSYFKDMNKMKKKRSDKTKETENPLQTIPECSPGCAYMTMNKTKNLSPNRSGTASPVRSNYTTGTKAESTIINKTTPLSQKQILKSPDKNSLKNDEAKTTPLIRSNQQKTRVNIYQSDKNQKNEPPKSPDRFNVSGKRSTESITAEEKRESPEKYDISGVDTSRPGRIRITGRLGLTEDDKCILKCDATLNDKPIPTQFQGAACAMLPLCYEACTEKFRSFRKQRDAKVQAKESPMGTRLYARAETGKESQATQVDFQLTYSPALSRTKDSSRGKIMQKCACVNTVANASDIYDNKEDASIALKKHHSPLIVISVYSKNDESNEKSGDTKNEHIKTRDDKKDIKKIGRSRSPSPAKNNKKIVEKKSDSRVNASTSKKSARETARKITRTKLNQTQSRSTVRTISTKTRTESRTTKSRSPKAKISPPQSRRSNSPLIKQEEANVPEQLKRALIEDFTRTYTEHINQRNTHLDLPLQTKHNVSNITIDIEGDSEYYNVKLEQDAGKLNTELTVRKPVRGLRVGENTMSTMGETDTTSLENFLYMPENEHRKRSFSQTLMYDGTDLTMGGENDEGNTLNVKDSIEVSHRRETKASVNDDYREINDDPNEVDSKYLAQTRHFQGDDCLIPNPVTRDREIQKLLGIDKGVRKYKTMPSKPSTAVRKSCHVGKEENNSNRTIITKKTKNENADKDSLYDVINNVILIKPLHQMAWNKNIQVFYHLSMRRPKPIILTRRQYDKLKRRIYNSLFAKHNAYYYDRRLHNFHKHKLKIVRGNTNNKIMHYDKDSQTEKVQMDQICATASDANTYTISKTNCGDAGSSCIESCKMSSSTNTFENFSNANCPQQVINVNNYQIMHNTLRTIYIAKEHIKPNNERFKKDHVLKTESVKDVQYRKMAIRKQRVRFSSSDSANYLSKAEDVKKMDACSVQTIFKCHRKSITPNLGTSVCTLSNSSANIGSRFKLFEDSIQDKPKKPFLKRLMSCLVFKISPTQTKHPRALLDTGSPDSSFDSYYISTSLGAIEMSSSLYETSASFYSDHTVPGTKIKRGFLSSVRGLLTRKY